ncbi:MAG: sialate O-acetylesterase [Opitutales bacterium]
MRCSQSLPLCRLKLLRGLVLALACLLPVAAAAKLRLPRHIGDHMVLQQASAVPLWGWAEPGVTVSVEPSWSEQPVRATAAEDGRWEVILQTPRARPGEAPTPHQIVVAAPTERQVLREVLIGEVWLLSGQSNMEMQLRGWPEADPPSPITGGPEAIATSDDDGLRLFIAGRRSAAEPQTTVAEHWAVSRWSPSTPATAAEFSAVGYFFGRELRAHLEVPVGLILSAWGGSSAEAWIPAEVLQGTAPYAGEGPWKPASKEDNQSPSVLYNGMIAPLAPYAVRGVLWYQGETNVGRHDAYPALMTALIESWREHWGDGEMPFFFAQLAPWGGYGPTSLQELWAAQSATLEVPATGMVSTIDLGDAANIHPAAKQPIGYRFALLARAEVYGEEDLVASGPRCVGARAAEEGLRLLFEHADGGLVFPQDQLGAFELAGENGVFHPAYPSLDGSTIVLHSPTVTAPRVARYAWSPLPRPVLFNRAGLPAAPFRVEVD